jgi:hypothetical protein
VGGEGVMCLVCFLIPIRLTVCVDIGGGTKTLILGWERARDNISRLRGIHLVAGIAASESSLSSLQLINETILNPLSLLHIHRSILVVRAVDNWLSDPTEQDLCQLAAKRW